jgi:hypothetical protein
VEPLRLLRSVRLVELQLWVLLLPRQHQLSVLLLPRQFQLSVPLPPHQCQLSVLLPLRQHQLLELRLAFQIHLALHPAQLLLPLVLQLALLTTLLVPLLELVVLLHCLALQLDSLREQLLEVKRSHLGQARRLSLLETPAQTLRCLHHHSRRELILTVLPLEYFLALASRGLATVLIPPLV